MIRSQVSRTQRQDRVTVNVTGAPGMTISGIGDPMAPTVVEFVYRSSDHVPDGYDATILFGRIHGHYPSVSYWESSREFTPPPRWLEELAEKHAPAWWGQS